MYKLCLYNSGVRLKLGIENEIQTFRLLKSGVRLRLDCDLPYIKGVFYIVILTQRYTHNLNKKFHTNCSLKVLITKFYETL